MSNEPKKYKFSFDSYPNNFDINIDLSNQKLNEPISVPHMSLVVEKIVKRKNKKVALTKIYIHDQLSTEIVDNSWRYG